MKVLITFFLITICTSVLGQNPNISTIKIQAKVMGSETFLIDIFKNSNTLKLIYKRSDSVSRKIDVDTAIDNYRAFIRNNPSKKEDVMNAVARIEELSQQYTFYTIDSLEFIETEKNEFINLIDSIFNSPTELLERKSENANRMILDGTKVRFILNRDDQLRTIYVHQPNQTSHPLLWDLIHESLEVYRNTKRNAFLNVRQTYGY